MRQTLYEGSVTRKFAVIRPAVAARPIEDSTLYSNRRRSGFVRIDYWRPITIRT
jgi:hypothetical protein